MRVVMRVDETRHDQLAGGIDRPVGGTDSGADSGDAVALDEHVGDRRQVGVAVMVVDPAAPDQNAGRSLRHCRLRFRWDHYSAMPPDGMLAP